jgi:hypothetical protein
MSSGPVETEDGPVSTLRHLLKEHRIVIGLTQAALAKQVAEGGVQAD